MTSPNPARDEEGLLPCPFCGSEARHEERHNPMSRWKHSIDCRSSSCGMSGPVASSKAEAVRLWNDRAALSAAKPPVDAVDAVARREAAMLVMEMAEDRDPDNVAEMFRIYENAPHDCEEHTGVRKPYGCGRCDVERAYAAADRIRSALSPAATSGSEAGGEAWPSSGGLNADWVAMVLAEDARIEDGKLANGPYLAVKIAEAADMPSEVARLRTALANVRDHTRETSTATMAIGALSGSRISSPAGGDVRDGALGWNSPEEWEIEQRAFHAAGRDDVPKDVQELVAILWKQYCIAAEPSAALSPSTSAAEPVAWRFRLKDDQRFGTRPGTPHQWTLSETEPANTANQFVVEGLAPLYATPPAPAAVDGQRVRALVWNEYETEGEVDRWDAETALGTFYEISTQFDGYHVAHDCTHLAARFDTLDDAKAVAQADYEARIRACLATDKEGA